MQTLGEKEDLWQRLSGRETPVIIYGMGNGADKLFDACLQYEIPVAGVAASPDFVRGQSFRGFPVFSVLESAERFPGVPLLLGFGSDRPDVLEQISSLNRQCELYAPDLPLYGAGLFCAQYAKDHAAELQQAYEMLADEQSRRAFQNTVAFKLNGEISYLQEIETEREEAFSLLNLNQQERYIDVGAYTGDTIEELCRITGGCAGVIAFEPDRRNFRKLQDTVKRRSISPAVLLQKAAWSSTKALSFEQDLGRGGSVGAGKDSVEGESIDRVAAEFKPTLIKIDAEGAEKQVLLGCKQTLQQYHPKLMVAAYHRNDDLFALPVLLRELYPGCRIYLRHHPYIPAWETNFYVRGEDA